MVTAEWELEQSSTTVAAAELALQELTDDATTIRRAIVNGGESAVPILLSLLTAENSEVRSWAATSLAAIGTNTPVAMDALLAASDDSDAAVRDAARAAIQQLADN